ncbi:MAG: hypothetical protein HYZ20_10210 [Burkholderiales bacterium]|nr:hypothetical protein [Burkholderiales bacterium]
MPAHVRSAPTATQRSIPVAGGWPMLGTWRGTRDAIRASPGPNRHGRRGSPEQGGHEASPPGSTAPRDRAAPRPVRRPCGSAPGAPGHLAWRRPRRRRPHAPRPSPRARPSRRRTWARTSRSSATPGRAGRAAHRHARRAGPRGPCCSGRRRYSRSTWPRARHAASLRLPRASAPDFP